ncbi:putative glucan endo-1,6-beta-glucosidase B [Geopyxis carbonaria]|nr:putative glucan endo-1,6-beta-glucosidase B [Geopyxis carbonaria]
MKFSTLLGASTLLTSAFAWLPSGKIRGVNLGSLFVVEPWMMSQSWASMGCGGQSSEFDCMLALGQEAGDAAFATHWDSWITQDDLKAMASYGLNTVRIPLGYWLKEDLVDSSEHFPRGGYAKLVTVAGWAKDAGLNIILDLHGAPGAQQANQPFTGQYAGSVGFYNDYNYQRSADFLGWLTDKVHGDDAAAFSTVFAIQVVNEPLQDTSKTGSMISTFYPQALNAIRAAEEARSVGADKQLHVQFMDGKWGSGDPKSNLPADDALLFDNHDYVKWTPGVGQNQNDYFWHSCNDDVSSSSGAVVVGEWSLAVGDDIEQTDAFKVGPANDGWYAAWWKAQTVAYEKQQGWIFWSWKTELGDDYRWSYKQAVEAGVIPKAAGDGASSGVCNI